MLSPAKGTLLDDFTRLASHRGELWLSQGTPTGKMSVFLTSVWGKIFPGIPERASRPDGLGFFTQKSSLPSAIKQGFCCAKAQPLACVAGRHFRLTKQHTDRLQVTRLKNLICSFNNSEQPAPGNEREALLGAAYKHFKSLKLGPTLKYLQLVWGFVK